MKQTIIGLRELREKTDTFINAVGKGKSFIVVRRSKPVFGISPPDEESELWERVVDFTKIKKTGVPLSEMFSYVTNLRSVTQGRGSYNMEFSHYDEVPANVAQQIIERGKK